MRWMDVVWKIYPSFENLYFLNRRKKTHIIDTVINFPYTWHPWCHPWPPHCHIGKNNLYKWREPPRNYLWLVVVSCTCVVRMVTGMPLPVRTPLLWGVPCNSFVREPASRYSSQTIPTPPFCPRPAPTCCPLSFLLLPLCREVEGGCCCPGTMEVGGLKLMIKCSDGLQEGGWICSCTSTEEVSLRQTIIRVTRKQHC